MDTFTRKRTCSASLSSNLKKIKIKEKKMVLQKALKQQHQMTSFGNNERWKRLLMCVGYSGSGVSGSQFQRNVSVEKSMLKVTN